MSIKQENTVFGYFPCVTATEYGKCSRKQIQ